MFDFPRDIEDRHSYPLASIEDVWVYNKLSLAEKLGYYCGPSGTPIERPGWYVQRPIMNCAGMGLGGVLEFQVTGDSDQPPYAAGYFWCEMFRGVQTWTEFEDGIPVDETFGTPDGDRLDYKWRKHSFAIATVPSVLPQSRHWLIEAIGGRIIEASPRGFPYVGGRVPGTYIKKYPRAPWGNDDYRAFYWRQE